MTAAQPAATRRAGISAGLIMLALGGLARAQPLTTAFTYQGELRTSGSLPSGAHDLRFRLYDALIGGSQLGSEQCFNNVQVATGRFTVPLDFGAQFAGQQRFLEIDVRTDTGLACADTSGYTLLAPRQALTAAPGALFALNAATAITATSATTATSSNNSTQLNGQAASFYQNAANLSSGTLADARLGGTYSGILSLSNAGNAFTGSGAGLTALNASNINAGTLNIARLPVPFALTGTNAGHIISGQNASAAQFSTGVYGLSSAATGTTYGVHGLSASTSNTAAGVFGEATGASGGTYGVYGRTDSVSGRGVYGFASATTGTNYGGRFISNSTSGSGVYATASADSGTTYGVYGQSHSTSGVGVYGDASVGSGTTYGGYFESASTAGRGVYGLASASSGGAFGVYGQSDSASGRGVFGFASATTGTTYGGRFQSNSTSGYGLYATATATSGATRGILGQSASPDGIGVMGMATATTGVTYGVWGESNATFGARGVYGFSDAPSNTNYGVYGECASTSGRAVYGWATATSGVNYGGRFETASSSGYGVYGLNSEGGHGGYFRSDTGTGVAGYSFALTGSGVGVYGGSQGSSGRAVYGYNFGDAGTTYGVYGLADSPDGYAIYGNGDTGASGNKSFRIDHPEDPENKYLLHYSTESPEVLNAYSGTTTLDGSGQAVIDLPRYFARINRDPRYTLTAVGAPMPMLHVAGEIDGAVLSAGAKAAPGEPVAACWFRIAGGAPNAKVSWRIEAVRNDRWVQKRGAPVEIEKQDQEKGTYQHPELYGQPREKGMDYRADLDRERAAARGSDAARGPQAGGDR